MGTVDVQVLEVTGNEFKMFKADTTVYKELVIQVGAFKITAYYTSGDEIKAGNLIRMKSWQITNCWRNFKRCAIFIMQYEFIDDIDFIPVDALPVNINGILLKSRNTVKIVGISRKHVFSSVVRMDNGRGKLFSVLIVGFNKVAHELYALEDGVEVVVRGKLVLAKTTDDYEIQLKSIRKEIKN